MIFQFELGAEVKDKINKKFKGIITARAEYLYGCIKYLIESQTEINSQTQEPVEWWLDEGRIKRTEKSIKTKSKTPGGSISKSSPNHF